MLMHLTSPPSLSVWRHDLPIAGRGANPLRKGRGYLGQSCHYPQRFVMRDQIILRGRRTARAPDEIDASISDTRLGANLRTIRVHSAGFCGPNVHCVAPLSQWEVVLSIPRHPEIALRAFSVAFKLKTSKRTTQHIHAVWSR